MKLGSLLTYLLVFAILNLFVWASKYEKEDVTLSHHPVIIMISFDGFRYNFFDRPANGTPNLNRLKRSGSHVPYMTSQFPTKTYPNHMSIGTGLYVESHGVLDTLFYDPVLNEVLTADDPGFCNQSNKTLPFWTLNELEGHGRRTGSMMWPCANQPFGVKNTVPFHNVLWNDTVSFKDRVDTVISWVTDKRNPCNLVLLYFEEPDASAHAFGPESTEVTEQIARMDNITGYLIQELERLYIFHRVNLMLMSDHGFHEVLQKDIINVTQMVDSSLYNSYTYSPVLQIRPKDGKFEEVYTQLKNASVGNNFTTYKKEDIPTRWHFKNNDRITPIIIVADLGYVFDDFYVQYIDYYNTKFNRTASPSNIYGVHAYDNALVSMRAFFYCTWSSVSVRIRSSSI